LAEFLDNLFDIVDYGFELYLFHGCEQREDFLLDVFFDLHVFLCGLFELFDGVFVLSLELFQIFLLDLLPFEGFSGLLGEEADLLL
jgi:hypothetical protein